MGKGFYILIEFDNHNGGAGVDIFENIWGFRLWWFAIHVVFAPARDVMQVRTHKRED